MRSRVVVIAAIVAACGKDAAPTESKPATNDPKTEPKPVPTDAPSALCEDLPFAESTPVPEASGAGWLTIDGVLGLVVVSDSGHNGAYAVVDPESGKTLEEGTLPLGKGSDDVEGLAVRGDRLYGISSAGWMRVWQRKGKGFALVEGPYPLGPIDLPSKGGMGDKPPTGTGMVCALDATNCGRNYEGLCLAPHDPRGINPLLCTGFAASKADGHLYCITEANEPHDLVVHYDRRIAVDRPGVLSDCAFSEDRTLWAGNNLFGSSQVFRVDDWVQPETAKVVAIQSLGLGFPEVIAVRGDIVYRMSDTGGAPSLMGKFRCKAKGR